MRICKESKMEIPHLLPPLPRAYYLQPTLLVARDLLGKTLWRRTEEGLVSGIIVETEGYISAIDPAAHNYRKLSPRSAMMFGPAGRAYIYLIYGMYPCLNVVTEREGESAAVLIRAIMPTTGVDLMQRRCPPGRTLRNLARGPGRLCQALGLTVGENGTWLDSATLWISETAGGSPFTQSHIATSPRIGITRGTTLPWRYFIAGHTNVSGSAKGYQRN